MYKLKSSAFLAATLLVSVPAIAAATDSPQLKAYWANYSVYWENNSLGGDNTAHDYAGTTLALDDEATQAAIENLDQITYAFLQVNEHGFIYFSDVNADLLEESKTEQFCIDYDDAIDSPYNVAAGEYDSSIIGNNPAYGYIACTSGLRGIITEQANWPNQWRSNGNDSVFGLVDYVRNGMFNNLSNINTINPTTKKAIAIGGYGQDQTFYNIFANIDAFVDSVEHLVNSWGIDIVDFDWEPENLAEEPEYYEGKLGSFVEAVTALSARGIKVSVTLLANPEHLAAWGEDHLGEDPLQDMAEVAESINLMTYDYWGSWCDDEETGHQTNLYPTDGAAGFSVDESVKKLIELGVEEEKISIGIAPYARTHNASIFGDLDAVSEWESVSSGVFSYRFIHEALENNDLNLLEHYAASKGALLSAVSATPAGDDYGLPGRDGAEYFSFDNDATALAKLDYVRDNNLYGMILWDMRADVPANVEGSIIKAVGESINASK